MQKETIELINFWKNRFKINFPNEYIDIYELERIAYYYNVTDIVNVAVKLGHDLKQVVKILRKRNGCIEFEWTSKLESLYNWITTYYHTYQMSSFEFETLIKMGVKYDVNLICATAQRLINTSRPLNILYLNKVIESATAESDAREHIEQELVNIRKLKIEKKDTNKDSIDTRILTEEFGDMLNEI